MTHKTKVDEFVKTKTRIIVYMTVIETNEEIDIVINRDLFEQWVEDEGFLNLIFDSQVGGEHVQYETHITIDDYWCTTQVEKDLNHYCSQKYQTKINYEINRYK